MVVYILTKTALKSYQNQLKNTKFKGFTKCIYKNFHQFFEINKIEGTPILKLAMVKDPSRNSSKDSSKNSSKDLSKNLSKNLSRKLKKAPEKTNYHHLGKTMNKMKKRTNLGSYTLHSSSKGTASLIFFGRSVSGEQIIPITLLLLP